MFTNQIFAISVVNITDYNTDPDNIGKYPNLEFIVYTINNTRLFTFTPEYGSNNWILLTDAAERESVSSIDFDPCNGRAEITVNGPITTFTIAKYGDGRGGKISVNLPSKLCTNAFRTAGEMTINHITRCNAM